MKTRAKKKAAKRAEPDKPDLMFRTATIETRAGEEGEAPVVTMSVSSEEPVLTYTRFNDAWQYVYEVLDHKESSIDMARAKDGLVILDRHFGDQVGLMSVEIRDGKMGGDVEFCSGQRAQEIGKDAAKKLRKNVSVGYQVQEYAEGSEGTREGYPVVRATRWTPYEASFEPIPADTTVGVGRAEGINKTAGTPAEKKERKEMNPQEMKALFARAAKYGVSLDDVDMTDATAARAALDALIVDKQADDLAAERKTVIELKERKPEEKPAVRSDVTAVKPLGGDVKEENKAMKRYSLMNVLRSIGGQNVDITFEREVSDELAKRRGKPASGIIVPHKALASRDFTVSGTSSASVATDLYADDFIDLLRSKVPIAELGITTMNGLVGNVAIPKQTGASTAYWVAESTDITESQPTLGQVTGTPHTVGALVDISRRMLIQSTPDAENMVRDDIMRVLAIGVFTAIFAGTGANGQPSAITNASGMNNPSISSAGTPTYAEILAFIEAIYTDNAEGMNMKWIMTPEVWAKMCETMRTVTYGDVPILDPTVPAMLGYDWIKNTAIPANSLWFGDWSSVVLGIWGNGVDMIADTSTLSAQGGLRLVGLQDVDVMVRNGQKIAYNTAVTA